MAEVKQTLLTFEGKQDLEAMLPTLIARKREIKERLQGTKTYGDAADGGEGSEAKDALIRLDRRIGEIEHMLRTAKLVDTTAHDGTVRIGSRVTIDDADGVQETWMVVVAAEASTRNRKISDQSPMGAAMIGKRVGDEARVHAPGGDMVYRILAIE
jgi:transcription elongation factor GreA